MYDWQLMGKWEVYDELYPNQQLARIIEQKYKNIAYENEIDFYPPNNLKEFKDFIEKIFKITNLSIDKLHIKKEKEQMLNEILNGLVVLKSNEEIMQNYQGLCYIISQVLGYDR